MPCTCPSCHEALKVVRLTCDNCNTAVEGEFEFPVLLRLDDDEQRLILNLLQSSGSLKELARRCGVSYPTVRNRVDALIARVDRLEAAAGEEGED